MPIHIPLIISTACQRLGLGWYIFCVIANQFMGVNLPMNVIAITTLILLGVGALASSFHLGRPTRFLNAFSNFKSHLTQEAAVTIPLGLALLVASLDGYLYNLGAGSAVVQWITLILAVLFLYVTGLLYQLDARPAWNTSLVSINFMLTSAQVGSLGAMAVTKYYTGTIPTSLLVTAVIMFVLTVIAQYLYVQRLKTLGYGTAVNVMSKPYRSTFVTWFIFGVVAIGVCLVMAATQGAAVISIIALIASVVGISAWTILFFKVAIQVKMFPMYKTDLTVYF